MMETRSGRRDGPVEGTWNFEDIEYHRVHFRPNLRLQVPCLAEVTTQYASQLYC